MEEEEEEECAKPPTKNYQMEHPASSAGSRVTLTEYVQQMGRPATSVANHIISRKFVGEKHVKADMCDKSNQTSACNIHLATRAKVDMHGRCTICQRIKRLQENH